MCHGQVHPILNRPLHKPAKSMRFLEIKAAMGPAGIPPARDGKKVEGGAVMSPEVALTDVREVDYRELEADIEADMPGLPRPRASNPRILCVIHRDQSSSIRYPEHLGLGNATWGTVFDQLKRRMAWTEDGFSMEILDANSLDSGVIKQHANTADVFYFIGLGSNSTSVDLLAEITQIIPTGVCLGCTGDVKKLSRFDYQPASSFRIGKKIDLPFLPPWSVAGRFNRVFATVEELFSRGNHLDLYFSMLVLLNEIVPIELVGARSKLDMRGLGCLLKNCRRPLTKCLQDPVCKTCVDELDKVGLRDQVKAYTVIRSYQSNAFERLSLCINEKHNCLRNTASRPELPNIQPLQTFRGKPLSWEAAENILIGQRGPGKNASWMLVCGQNPAYDEFPCQYQMFYRGKARNSLWYNPVFKLHKLDGGEVWRNSDYKVRRDDVPGRFKFSFCDNGVTSLEHWHIVDAPDDLSWVVLYYSGAAKTAGQAYLGGMLATPDGAWPADSDLPRITRALHRAGIPWHEMVQVCNDFCSGAPLVPLHPERAPVIKPE